MALSGSVSTNLFSGSEATYGTVGLVLSWTASQSVEGNTSTINWTLKTYGTMTSGWWYYAGPINMSMTATAGTLGGSRSYSNSSRIKLKGGGTIIASGTATLTHNSSGNGSFGVSLSAAIYLNAVNCTGSGSSSLDAIARATTPRFNYTWYYLGSTPRTDDVSGIYIDLSDRASDSFTHTLTYSFGSATGTIVSNTDQAAVTGFTFPESLSGQIPESESAPCTITCETFSNGTSLGTREVTITLMAPTAWVPAITSGYPACSPANNALGSAVYPATITGVSVAVACAAVHDAVIRSITVRFQGKTKTKTYTAQSPFSGSDTIVTDACTGSGTYGLDVTVIDSRGRSTQASQIHITVSEYTFPDVDLTVIRVAGSTGDTANETGDYMHIVLAGEAANVGSNAAVSAALKYKISGGSDVDLSQSVSLSGRAASYESSTNIAVSNSLTCTVEASLTDLAGNTTIVTQILPVGFKTVDFLAGGRGIAFGTTAKRPRFECDMGARFNKEAVFKTDIQIGANLFDVTGTSATSGGITWTFNVDGSVSASGTAGSSNVTRIFGYFTGVAGHTYRLCGCPADGSATKHSLYVAVGSTNYWDYGEGVEFEYPANTEYVTIRGRAYKNKTYDVVFTPAIYDTAVYTPSVKDVLDKAEAVHSGITAKQALYQKRFGTSTGTIDLSGFPSINTDSGSGIYLVLLRDYEKRRISGRSCSFRP